MPIDREYIRRLQRAIAHLHDCGATHVDTVPVHETFEGETVWQGDVEVFWVNHSKAGVAYAWSYKDADGYERCAAVLGRRPINSPLDAVKAFLMSGARRMAGG